MSIQDVLLTSAQSAQQSSLCLWDYNTLNVLKYYKNGGTTAPNCLEILERDYIITAELGKPLLHLWLLNSQEVAKNTRLILPEPANCLAVCPQNTYLAVGINCKVYIWHMASGKLLSVQQKHYQPVSSVKFSSDGDFLLIGGQDGMLVNYCLTDLVAVSTNFLSQTDIGKVEPLYTKNDHSMTIKDIHVGTFGRKSNFATVSNDRTCRIYQLLTGELLCSLVFEDCLTSVVFDSYFGHLYVGLETGNIRQFNLKEPPRTLTHHVDEKSSLLFTGHASGVVCLALNISETVLASGSLDGFVYTWDIRNRQLLKKIKHNSPLTNIKFVVRHENFFAENIKPCVLIQSLERNLDLSQGLRDSQMQTENLEVSENEYVLAENETREELFKTNIQLRANSKKLFDYALGMQLQLEKNSN